MDVELSTLGDGSWGDFESSELGQGSRFSGPRADTVNSDTQVDTPQSTLAYTEQLKSLVAWAYGLDIQTFVTRTGRFPGDDITPSVCAHSDAMRQSHPRLNASSCIITAVRQLTAFDDGGQHPVVFSAEEHALAEERLESLMTQMPQAAPNFSSQ